MTPDQKLEAELAKGAREAEAALMAFLMPAIEAAEKAWVEMIENDAIEQMKKAAQK